ncbi:MAG: UDP-N-acetylglucosamine 1-carboxyvinyltransferase, partial [Ignavibacteriae bacterium]|nr:UDP-N-acetylglucosamine 1-carboxyvinyltransferase [Ignavibacteriota bacterium]
MDTNNSRFLINGGNPLYGSVKVSGAKNSATKLLVASLLTDEYCEFSNSPNKINDLIVTSELCDFLGSEIQMENDKLFVRTPEFVTDSIPESYGSLNRISILFAGPMLHRKGIAKIPIPGGCKIGSRPVNFHIEGLKQLGCHV